MATATVPGGAAPITTETLEYFTCLLCSKIILNPKQCKDCETPRAEAPVIGFSIFVVITGVAYYKRKFVMEVVRRVGMSKLRVLLSTIQILRSIPSSLDVQFPEHFFQFLGMCQATLELDHPVQTASEDPPSVDALDPISGAIPPLTISVREALLR